MPGPPPPDDAAGLDELDFTLIDALVVPASVHAPDGRFVHVNPAGEAASGFTGAELRGRHFSDLLPARSRAYVEEHFARAAGGEPVEFEVSFLDRRGRLVAARTQYVPLFSDAAVTGVLILAYDARADGVPPTTAARLTPRQLEILRLMAGAAATGDIARHLGISVETVRNHIRDLLAALDAHSRLEAVVKAKRHGLLPIRPLRARSDDAA